MFLTQFEMGKSEIFDLDTDYKPDDFDM